MTSIRERTSARLKQAMKDRDRDAIAVCRRLLAAFSNAEAVPTATKAGAIESAAMFGSADTEVARAVITEEAMLALAAEEANDLERSAEQAIQLGADDRADVLRRQRTVLDELL